ncbi:MAG TPA: hypothetical protein VM573_03130 [Actinomycetota bacterium]|jgi:hypothetical protein|nr:hypothetical protein [Actinomycetota bacterium]
MKRLSTTFMVLGLVVGSVATAEAGKPERKRVERTVEGSYGAYPAPVTGCNNALGSYACMIVEARSTEAFFTAQVRDAHGQPVFVQVRSDGAQVATFCGETPEPIRIARGSSLEFYVALENWPGDFQPDCPANRVKTNGTISVTLSNRP